jgi:hypothetical protein
VRQSELLPPGAVRLFRAEDKGRHAGDGSVLDHSVVVYGGTPRQARQGSADGDPWMSPAAVSDVPCEKLGDSTGKLEALEGIG